MRRRIMTTLEDEERLPRTRIDHLAAWVLARLCTDTRPATMRDALGVIDPLERGRVRTRVQTALDDGHALAPDGELAHVRRLAFLDASGVYLSLDGARDVTAVRERAEVELARPRAKPRWRTTLFTVASLVLVSLGITAFFVLRPVPFEGLRPGPGGARDAYRAGGVPVHGPMLDTIFSDILPKVVVASSRVRYHGGERQAELDRAMHRLAEGQVRDALPSDVHGRLQAAARAYAAWAKNESNVEAVEGAVRALDEALARTGLGYFVDAVFTGNSDVALAMFSVDRVRVFDTAGGRRERVLFLRRIDHINLRQSAIAYTRNDAKLALVLIDAVDANLVETLLPLLAEEHLPTLADERTTLESRPWLAPVHERAEAVVREDLAAGARSRPLTAVAELLERRRVLHYQLLERTARAGFALAYPDRYDFAHEGLDRIEPAPMERGELERIRDSLGERENVTAFLAARRIVEDLFAWHALEYRLDTQAVLHAPEPLVALLDPGHVREPGFFDGSDAARELSAFLASIARDATSARTALTLIVRWLTNDRARRIDLYAAWALIPELARTLHVGAGRAPIELRPSDVTELYVALSRLPGARLRDGAKQTWARLFGRPLPEARAGH